MELKLFKTLWGCNGPAQDAVAAALATGFDGVEGPAPPDKATRDEFERTLRNGGLGYIAEITTAGSYVPEPDASLSQHLESLEQQLAHSAELNPLFVTCLGGCDSWTESLSVEFFGRAMDAARRMDLEISFETHRGRSLFNPWTTLRIIEQLPDLQLTCDFSHWCVVCERVFAADDAMFTTLAPRAKHLHARVGYDQGPQVNHPAAPEHARALHSHQAWWQTIWHAQLQRGFSVSTMTPEFGPDGYLHELPFTATPVADLDELNLWMAQEERRHFTAFRAMR